MAVPARILTVNAGSSSLKLRLLGPDDELLLARDLGPDEGSRREGLAALAGECRFDAVGHRVVHGGPDRSGPVRVDPSLEHELDALADLAPLQNPPAVAAMRELDLLSPGVPTVACFDSDFHATIPAAAATYAVPAEWRRRWPLRRLGFHGLSHAYASRRAAELLGRPIGELRTVTAHLGAGASLAAVAGGRSVDTTMGFTPLEGLVMATRAGSVDPGLLLWVQRHGNLGPEEIERALDRQSGLLALAGTADMREVVAGAEAGDEGCQLAFDVYVHRLAGGVAAMATALGGIDALVFTGGVGEGSWAVRVATVEATAFLGPRIDPSRNATASGDAILSPVRAPAAVLRVEAREDLEIVAQTRRLLGTEAAADGSEQPRPAGDRA